MYKKIVKLLGVTFCRNGFVPKTKEECELVALLKEAGCYYKTENDISADPYWTSIFAVGDYVRTKTYGVCEVVEVDNYNKKLRVYLGEEHQSVTIGMDFESCVLSEKPKEESTEKPKEDTGVIEISGSSGNINLDALPINIHSFDFGKTSANRVKQKQQENIAKKSPENSGLPWSKSAIALLKSFYENEELFGFVDDIEFIKSLATFFGRSVGSIRSIMRREGISNLHYSDYKKYNVVCTKTKCDFYSDGEKHRCGLYGRYGISSCRDVVIESGGYEK